MSLIQDVLNFDIIRGAQPVRLRHIEPAHRAPCNSCGRATACSCQDGDHILAYCYKCSQANYFSGREF